VKIKLQKSRQKTLTSCCIIISVKKINLKRIVLWGVEASSCKKDSKCKMPCIHRLF